MELPKVTMGICAYNEEANIYWLLEALQKERLDEIIVVASGCTDNTVVIAKAFKNVAVIEEPTRSGKASAINLILKQAKGDIVILESADTIPGPGSLNRLVRAFDEPSVGMAGARPIPMNPRNSLAGYVSSLIWDLHHAVSTRNPKMGEVVAFRKTFERITPDILVDEANIEILLRGQGYEIIYEPQAIVYNKGPETLKDLVRQRRRVYLGHVALKKKYGYRVSTLSSVKLLGVLLKDGYLFRETGGVMAAMGLEFYCRLLARWDFARNKNTSGVWERVHSTKELST